MGLKTILTRQLSMSVSQLTGIFTGAIAAVKIPSSLSKFQYKPLTFDSPKSALTRV